MKSNLMKEIISLTFRPICRYKLADVILYKKLVMRHINPLSSSGDAVRNNILMKYLSLFYRRGVFSE